MTRNKKEAENNHTNQTSHDLRKLGMHFTQPVMLRWHPPSMAFLWFVRAVAFVISASQTVIVEFRQMFYGCSSLDGPNLSECDQNGPSHSHSFSAGVFRTSLAFLKENIGTSGELGKLFGSKIGHGTLGGFPNSNGETMGILTIPPQKTSIVESKTWCD